MWSTQPNHPHLKYRPDIDGMRAAGVISVIVFHAFPSILPAGFIGVDIFFVISGFLITGIILKDLREDNFSFGHFYARRIRRIFPALFLVLATTIVLAWFFLFPDEFKQLGKHLLGGAAFVSNLVLWNESGYFDAGAESKPLLHLWSLGIEEQFYIFFPILLAWLFRRHKKILPVLLIVAAFSFCLNVIAIGRYPVAVFYAPLTRIWELLAGSILAYVSVARQDKVFNFPLLLNTPDLFSILGIVAISVSALFLNPTKAFPGAWALLPVSGAVLFIAAGPKAWFNRRILGSPVLVSIGLISYPLYLWHWPLLSFLSIVSNGDSSAMAKICAIVVAFVLAGLTYVAAEKRIRTYAWPQISNLSLCLPVAAIGLIGLTIYQFGFSTRLGGNPQLASIYSALNDRELPDVGVTIKGARPEKILFIGDSFLQHYYSRIKKLTETSDHSYSAIYAGVGGCPPIPGVERIADPGGCSTFNNPSFELARQPDIKKVVLGSAWHYFYPIAGRSKLSPYSQFEHDAMLYIDGDASRQGITPGSPTFSAAFLGFETAAAELVSLGKEVYIVLPSPISEEFEPRSMIDRVHGLPIMHAGVSKSTYSESFAPIITQLTTISKRTGSKLLDPTIDLCPNGFCSAFYGPDPIYTDIGHIRPFFVRDHMSIFDDVILR